MNNLLQRREGVDFEELGFQTTLLCGDDEERAKNICGLRIHAYEDQLQPEIATLRTEIEENRNHGNAHHDRLYNRTVPVNDAAMLVHGRKVRNLRLLIPLAAIACLAGSAMTFSLFGFGIIATFIFALGATVVPLFVGHPLYEHILAKHRKLEIGIIALAAVLAALGGLCFAGARLMEVGKMTSGAPAPNSYVDGAPVESTPDQGENSGESDEARVRKALGVAMLLIMLAAELMFGYFFGLLGAMKTDEDYVAWLELKEITKLITKLEETVSQLELSVEIAKKDCAAGILKAQVALRKRRIPYFRALTAFIFCAILGTATARAQTIERYEGILIDTSGSISQGGTNDLFKQYLESTKKLLVTETPNTRVWVSNIAVDSFGGESTVLKGWTPDARGVFTEQLDRARRELALAFEKKASGLSPVAAGTDIFGALWRFKALFESAGNSGKFPKTIWIFSDMVNESRNFLMPNLIATGPEQMLERAKANGLVVPLNGYKIYIYGATPSGLTPQGWITVKNFWTAYFRAAGAELVTYSAECDLQR